jgi:hypothetical protein
MMEHWDVVSEEGLNWAGLSRGDVKESRINTGDFVLLRFGAMECRVLRTALRTGKVTGPPSPPPQV